MFHCDKVHFGEAHDLKNLHRLQKSLNGNHPAVFVGLLAQLWPPRRNSWKLAEQDLQQLPTRLEAMGRRCLEAMGTKKGHGSKSSTVRVFFNGKNGHPNTCQRNPNIIDIFVKLKLYQNPCNGYYIYIHMDRSCKTNSPTWIVRPEFTNMPPQTIVTEPAA